MDCKSSVKNHNIIFIKNFIKIILFLNNKKIFLNINYYNFNYLSVKNF